MDKKSILKGIVSGVKGVGNSIASASSNASNTLRKGLTSKKVTVYTKAPVIKSPTPPGADKFLSRKLAPPGASSFLKWENIKAKQRMKQRDPRMD
jgi:hypothetical protein